MTGHIASPLLTPEEACKYLRISSATLYKMIKEGTVPVIKLGRQYRIRASDLDNKRGDERYDR